MDQGLDGGDAPLSDSSSDSSDDSVDYEVRIQALQQQQQAMDI